MVTGFESFKRWFSEYSEQYTIIGGTACDLLMSEEGMDFRATRDIDMVLIVESLTPQFGERFWSYIRDAGYEHRNKSTGEPQFYRFTNPKSRDYPYMIELFSRRANAIVLSDDAVLTPLPLDHEISSLSAILLDDAYYQFLREGKTTIDGIPILDAMHLIPFKAKAWLDRSSFRSFFRQGESAFPSRVPRGMASTFPMAEGGACRRRAPWPAVLRPRIGSVVPIR